MPRITEARLAKAEAIAAASAGGHLTWRELAELAAMEAEYAARFPGVMPGAIHGWSAETVDDFLAHQASDQAGRHDELRHRARTPEQRADDHAHNLAIAAMTAEERESYYAAYLEEHSRR